MVMPVVDTNDDNVKQKRRKMENVTPPVVDTNDGNVKQKRRVIVFFLVNPGKCIVSTRKVAVQQKELGGVGSSFEPREGDGA